MKQADIHLGELLDVFKIHPKNPLYNIDLPINAILVNQVADIFPECTKVGSIQDWPGFLKQNFGIAYQEALVSARDLPAGTGR